MSGHGQGRGSRLSIGVLVFASSLLALVALFAVNWLAGRPGVRMWLDLTETDQNTLSTAARGVIGNLPEDVTIDVFFRPENYPLTQVGFMAQERTRRLLLTFRESSSGRIEVRSNDPKDAAAFEDRLRELRVRGFENCLVVSSGKQREVLTLRRDLATFDPGKPPPDPRPARLLSFDAERAIVRALLAVTRGDTLDVYFTTGRGEREIFGEDGGGMSHLQELLAEDGLRVGRWNSVEDGPLPENTACLSIIGPTDGFDDAALDAIESYVRDGGRLVLAPHTLDAAVEQSRIAELAERFGIEIQAGTVCQPVRDLRTGQIFFRQQRNAVVEVPAQNMTPHPLVAPIREAGRAFALPSSHPVRVAVQTDGGSASVLCRSPVESWLEIQRPGDALFNFFPDPDEEQGRPIDLAVASAFPAGDGGVPQPLEERPEARIVVLGSGYAFSNDAFENANFDLLRNVYNWVLAREYRILISPKDPDVRRFPPDQLERVAKVSRFAWGWLPGLCLVCGLATAFWRTLGGPRKKRNRERKS